MSGRTEPGFTIVELLIVIVVIGILAAITIVSFNGVQGRANDTAVKADLVNNSRKILLYESDNAAYPNLGQLTTDLQLQYSRNSYKSAIYCKNASRVVLVSQSTSNNAFMYDTTTGSISDVPSSTNVTACASFGILNTDPSPSIATVRNASTGVWSSLVK